MTRKLVAFIVSFLIFGSAFAEDNCINCPKRKVDGLPTPANMESIASLASKAADNKDADFDSDTRVFCLKYENMSSNQTYNYAKEIDASPYPINTILQNPACMPRKIGGDNRITIMQLTVESPFSRLEHMEKMYNYIMKKHKKESIFTDAVNALNTDGMTMLDYIYFVLNNGNFTTQEGKDQVNKIRSFVCGHGGVYSKYKDQKCL
ncbi:MAG: hypothetical protein COW00_10020 [Bdellovibrio sp. CG12_big_fil_rev_8_21_14_0_65_39_13]|nr:MAG: hypothetical protein COW78_01295 [Bdellovibrio sp. CG22_combo_CG10-13_8_21_14_all_39_27]PIQ59447.1 MAG: hypothetical protein COW00_10020 [Bdellovibrio sp. CG12_big_fil_rev_8_21_14_0_65_39_13]